MQVYNGLDTLPPFAHSVLTIGTFDGVHLGHRRIISQIVDYAGALKGESIVITFHPHPRIVIHPEDSSIRLLTTVAEKSARLAELGVNHHVVVPFSRDFSEQDAEVYIRDFLVARFKPARIVIGYDHRFGKDRAGDIRLLAALADRYDYILEEISKETIDDIAISSTKIRDALHNGQISIATRLLGYYYTLSGIVVKGQQIGRTIGYPTANLQIADPYKLIPQRGIYAVWVTVSGARYMGMLSIGYNPTFERMEQTIEVHIVNYDGDIYGETITLEFVKYIRDEVKYDNIPELVAAIDADKVKILEILS